MKRDFNLNNFRTWKAKVCVWGGGNMKWMGRKNDCSYIATNTPPVGKVIKKQWAWKKHSGGSFKILHKRSNNLFCFRNRLIASEAEWYCHITTLSSLQVFHLSLSLSFFPPLTRCSRNLLPISMALSSVKLHFLESKKNHATPKCVWCAYISSLGLSFCEQWVWTHTNTHTTP